MAHRKFGFSAPNLTPFGAVIAAPPPERRELVCRDGLKYYARIPGKNIRAALEEVENREKFSAMSKPLTPSGKVLATELDLAAGWRRNRANSCSGSKRCGGQRVASQEAGSAGIRELQELDKDFRKYWPLRNKGNMEKCAAFLEWRMRDYRSER